MVKVGDKIKVVNAKLAGGQYKNGDIFTVEQVIRDGDVYIKEHNKVLLEKEYEPYNPVNVGDTVKLIDNFYEHEAFKADSRHIRKQIAGLKDTELEVKDICTITDRVSTGKITYSVPIELLEKVEPDSPVFEAGKSYVFDKTLLDRKPRPDSWESDADGGSVEFEPGNWGGSVKGYAVVREWCREAKHRYTDEQIAEAQRIIGEIVADFPNGVSVNFRKEGNKTYTYIGGVNFDRFAICAKTDEYNQTIGRMVALCKQVRRPLPEWL